MNISEQAAVKKLHIQKPELTVSFNSLPHGELKAALHGSEMQYRGRSQDGGGVGRGDHFLFYKFIERTTER